MKLTDFFGKYVAVKDTDGVVYKGLVSVVETEADADDGIANIDLIYTKQFPYSILGLNDNEISEIKIIDSKDIGRPDLVGKFDPYTR